MKLSSLLISSMILVATSAWAQPIITHQPVSQTAIAGTNVTFSVSATGTPPLSYQWVFNFLANRLPGATNDTLILPNVQTSNAGIYRVVITNVSGSVQSASARLTVVQSEVSPSLVSASSVNGTEVGVCFSEVMSLAGLNSPANYQVVGASGLASIASVGLWPGNTSVVLRLNTPVSGVFTVSAQGLTDAASNPILSGSTVTGRVWGTAISVETIGAPSPHGEFISCQDGSLSVRGGGSLRPDSPAFQYLHELRTNDFDVQVRVDSLVKHGDPNGTGIDSPYIASGGLMVRNSLEPFSASTALLASPTNGSRLFISQIQRVADEAAPVYKWGDSAEGYPLWLRIRRSGNNFTSYGATNGTDWVAIGEPQTLRGAAAIMRVGLITVPFSEGVYATAEYRDFGDTPLRANARAMVTITQPPTSVTVEANHPASFTAFATVSGAPPSELKYQWQVETSPGSGAFTNVFLATFPRYTTAPLSAADSGARVRIVASVIGGSSAVSATATVTVIDDVTPPRILSATSKIGGNDILVTFAERVERSTAEDPFNYTGNDFDVAAPALDASATRVNLTLNTLLNPGTTHELTVRGVQDLAGRAIEPSESTVAVTAPTAGVRQRGAASQELYFGISGESISALRSAVKFPDAPDDRTLVNQLEGPLKIDDDYGTRVSGLLVPPISGNYNFWIASDAQGEFWLSADEFPANLVLVCHEPGWNGFRNFNGLARRDPSSPENRSSTLFPNGLPLAAGQLYYFESLGKAGGGADSLSVAWQIPGTPAPADGAPPIPGAYLAMLGNPVDTLIQITRQPSNVVCFPPGTAADHSRPLFSQDFAGTNGGFTPQQTGDRSGAWTYDAAAGLWSTDGAEDVGDSEKLLMSPKLVVTQPGEVRLRFQHRFSFEEGMFDGGQVRISVNGNPFTAVPRSAFSSNGYTGAIYGGGALLAQVGFGNTSAGYANGDFLTSAATLGVFIPGDVLVIQFLGSWDGSVVASTPGWVIDNVELTEGHPGRTNAKFSIEATALNLDTGAAPLSMVWQRDCGNGFTDIIGANEATYIFQPTQADSQCRFRCVLYTPGATATSEVATLNFVLPALSVIRDGTELTLTWAEGVLQEAEAVPGTWQDVPQAASPARLPTTSARRFFRLRSP